MGEDERQFVIVHYKGDPEDDSTEQEGVGRVGATDQADALKRHVEGFEVEGEFNEDGTRFQLSDGTFLLALGE